MCCGGGAVWGGSGMYGIGRRLYGCGVGVKASVVEVPSASALQVLRRLGSIFTLVYAAVQKLKKDSWLELQFSLADNSKLNVVYLLNRS
ncbi:hypothetical protein Tco_0852051 [Tanacetum coccineum]